MWAKIWNWLTNWGKKKLPTVAEIKPVTPVKPVATSCGCNLSLPPIVPLVPEMGATDEAVDTNLRERWQAGTEDACGGLQGDIRPLLIRPCGKTFGWKYVITEGFIRLVLNGDKMTVGCGDYKGQRLHVIGTSDHEMPAHGKPATLEDWVPIVSGQEGPKKHFVYFECRKAVAK